ncbi:MAG: sulfatase-like hydrolase/transferase, partial [Planctomycetota bacterium]
MTRRVTSLIGDHFDAARDDEPPLLICYFSQAIHTPIEPAVEIGSTKVRDTQFHRVSDFLFELDTTIGEMMDAFDAAGELSNTLFVFTSDNGAWSHNGLYAAGHDPNGILSGYKGLVWEGGIRVPYVVSWPAAGAEGATSERVVGGQDLFATFAELTGQT